MVLLRKDFTGFTRKSSYIVSTVLFLSLISCTTIHGKNSSECLSDHGLSSSRPTDNSFPVPNHTEKQKTEFFKFSLQRNVSFVTSDSKKVEIKSKIERSVGNVVMNNSKTLLRRETDDRMEQDLNGPCRSFVMDISVRNEFEFYSPGHTPHQPYPSQMDCVKTIVAPPGHLLRLDFRDEFHLEQSEDCRFDYLEIRDGAHGYSNLLGSFCGNKHPPPITSSDRYLWLRFASDENIQYTGFHAVYWYIPRPTNPDQHPEMDMCQIEVSGNEGFANRSDIDEERVRFSVTYGLPLDCMWVISVEQGWKIMLQFLKFRLEKPNDCESNFVDVFSDRTDLPSRLKNFCGSIADSVISKSNILHLRFFAEARSINSTFEALFTAFRDKPRDEVCDEDEYDCEDATCISIDLRCNGRINCRFRWDEDECQPKLGAFAVILESEHIVIILVVFCLILSGMCFAFVFNCTKKLVRDHRLIQAHLRQSKEDSLFESKARSSVADSVVQKVKTISNNSNSNSTSTGSLNQDGTKLSSQIKPQMISQKVYNPSSEIIPVVEAKKIKEYRREETPKKNAKDNLEFSDAPETKDSECQTRESLFSTEGLDMASSNGSPVPISFFKDPKDSSDRSVISDYSHDAPPFSTFGYPMNYEAEGSRQRDQGRRNEALGLPRCYGDSRSQSRTDPGQGKRYKAEAVIEMETQKKEDSESSSAVRPFSINSTKSAPDVIVTH